MKTSNFGTIAKSQIKKGLLLFLVPFIGFVIQWMGTGDFPTTWAELKPTVMACLVPVMYYILSLLQNSDGEHLTPEKKDETLNVS